MPKKYKKITVWEGRGKKRKAVKRQGYYSKTGKIYYLKKGRRHYLF